MAKGNVKTVENTPLVARDDKNAGTWELVPMHIRGLHANSTQNHMLFVNF